MNLTDIIATQRKGKCLTEAQDKFQELVKACSETGKKGKFTLTFNIIAADGTVILSDEVATKIPTPNKPSTTFFADDHGALHRDDPRQPEFAAVVKMENAVNQ